MRLINALVTRLLRLHSTLTIMVLHRYWLHLSTIVFGLAFPSWASFENTGVVRSVDLGGSLVYTTTTYNVKALEDGSNVYVFALTEKEQETTSWMEAKVKGNSAPLSLENHGLSHECVLDLVLLLRRCTVAEDIIYSATYYYSVALPKALDTNQTANLVLETVQTHAAYPFPPEVDQSDPQTLRYDADLLVLSPYKTLVQRTKFKCVGGQCRAGIAADRLPIILGLLDSRSSVTQNLKKSPSRRAALRPRVTPEPLSLTDRSMTFRPPRIPLSLRRTSRRSPSTMSLGSPC